MNQKSEGRMWWIGWVIAAIAGMVALCAPWGARARTASLTRMVADLQSEVDFYFRTALSVADERDAAWDDLAQARAESDDLRSQLRDAQAARGLAEAERDVLASHLRALLSPEAAAAPTPDGDIHDCWPVTSSADPCLWPPLPPLEYQHTLSQFEDALLWCYDAGIVQGYMTSCVEEFLATAR